MCSLFAVLIGLALAAISAWDYRRHCLDLEVHREWERECLAREYVKSQRRVHDALERAWQANRKRPEY